MGQRSVIVKRRGAANTPLLIGLVIGALVLIGLGYAVGTGISRSRTAAPVPPPPETAQPPAVETSEPASQVTEDDRARFELKAREGVAIA